MEIMKVIELIENVELRNMIKSKLGTSHNAANELMKEFVSRLEIATDEPSQ